MIRIKSNHHDENVVSLAWAITEFCDKRCNYCTSAYFLKSLKAKGIELYFPEERLALDDHIANMLPKVVTKGEIIFYGGEPTLHPRGIEYFNKLCKEMPEDVRIIFITHGDITKEQLESFDTNNRKNYVITFSYHYYQTKFEPWLENAKILSNKFDNLLLSAIIPRQQTVWEDFRNKMRVMLDTGMHCEIKSEHDKNNEPDLRAIREFKDLIDEANKWRTHLYGLVLSEGDAEVFLPNVKSMSQIPLIPNKSICKTGQFAIVNNRLARACGEGNYVDVSINTTPDELKKYIDNITLTCVKNVCKDSTNTTTNITVFGASLNDKKYKDFVMCEMKPI